MSKRTIINLIIIVCLIMLFPLLWLYNQRLNYRKFLTLDTKFSLNANTYKPAQLSSVQYVLDLLKKADVQAVLDVEVKNPDDFGVLGRIINTLYGQIEVYEYSSPEDVKRKYEELILVQDKPDSLYIYKNILIYNRTDEEKVNNIFEGVMNEKDN